METDIRRRRQWPKCVGCVIRAAWPVSRSFRISASWDRNFAVGPCHRLGQRHRGQAGLPEAGAVATAPQLGETAAQDEGERRAACVHPVPPTARRMAGDSCTAGRVAQRGASQHVQQNALLFGPWVPAARCNAQRQTRTGTAAGATAESGNRHRIERGSRRAIMIGFAFVVAMQPRAGDAAVGACIRPVHFRGMRNLLNMLG